MADRLWQGEWCLDYLGKRAVTETMGSQLPNDGGTLGMETPSSIVHASLRFCWRILRVKFDL